MVNKEKIKYYSLLLSLLLAVIGLTIWASVWFQSADTLRSKYYSEVQNNINRVLISSNENLKSPVPEGFYSYSFDQDKCIYWSTNAYIPKFKEIENQNIINWNGTLLLVNKLNNKVQLIPLYQDFISPNKVKDNGFNRSIFKIAPQQIFKQNGIKGTAPIFDLNKKVLFTIKPPTIGSFRSIYSNKIALIFFGLSILVLGVFFLKKTKEFYDLNKFRKSFLYLFSYFIILKTFVLVFKVPKVIWEQNYLYNQESYWYSQSLLDKLINWVFFTILMIVLVGFIKKSAIVNWVKKTNLSTRSLIIIIIVVGAILGGSFCFSSIRNLYLDYGFQYRLSADFSFNKQQFVTLLYFLAINASFFLFLHLAAVLYINFVKERLSYIIFGSIIAFIFLFATNNFQAYYLFIPIYFYLIIQFKFPKSYYDFNYYTWLYLIFGSFVFCLVSVIIITQLEFKEDIIQKRSYGSEVLGRTNSLSIELLNQKFGEIQKDKESLILSDSLLEAKVKSKYLDAYDNYYEISSKKYPLNNAVSIKKRIIGEEESLENNITFFHLGNEDIVDQYIVFIPINNNQVLVTVLKSKLQNSYPELNTPMENRNSFMRSNFSYGIFDKERNLISNRGSYNYTSLVKSQIFNQINLYLDGIKESGYWHNGTLGNNQRLIVVSSVAQYLQKFLANLSFLYLLCLFVISLILGFYWTRLSIQKKELNFSTKIQLYLNLAFLTPILFLVLVSVNAIRNTLIQKQEEELFDKSETIANSIQNEIEYFSLNKQSEFDLNQALENIARTYHQSINFYDTEGNLKISTKPLLFEERIVSTKMPFPILSLFQKDKEKQYLDNTSYGELPIKNWYINIKNQQNVSLGIVNMPVYNFDFNLNQQLSSVVGSILTVFVLLFLILLAMSQIAAKQLTRPLKHIALKLKQTKIDQINEKLIWEANDEIGVLTQSYNEMLEMFEESKFALSQSEKQTAWREMAKQVAHEIKNPLTPMKLTIQQLQRLLQKEDAKIDRALNSINEQIDNISEIANSFSEFAKMPIPKSEKVELKSIIQNVYNLYLANKSLDIEFNSEIDNLEIRGDQQLLSRIFSNLIINGIQAVNKDKRPKIKIELYTKDQRAIVAITDNGEGIPAEIQKKVFIPNFSTKSSGSGLGLAMAKRGLEHGGGNIWFETTLEKGSTFFVDLPI